MVAVNSLDASFDSALIVLEKTGPIDHIMKCEDWNNETFSCGSWVATDIPFDQNSTHVWFNVTSFSAYAGASITVLNVYTYLRDGDTWDVAFNTTGTSDLVINSTNANWTEMLTDNPVTADEMRFLDVRCGETSLTERMQVKSEDETTYNYSSLTENDSIKAKEFLIPDYSCNETGHFSNYMFKAGYAALRFSYGGQTAYAYDPDFTPCQTNITWSVQRDLHHVPEQHLLLPQPELVHHDRRP